MINTRQEYNRLLNITKTKLLTPISFETFTDKEAEILEDIVSGIEYAMELNKLRIKQDQIDTQDTKRLNLDKLRRPWKYK